MKSKKWSTGKGAITLIITFAIMAVLIFGAAVGYGEKKVCSAEKIKLGLDLAGGVSITYQVAGDTTPTEAEMDDTVYKLQKRVSVYSTEAVAYKEGNNRITVEIPGVSDANKVLTELGKPGSLEFQTSTGEVILTGSDIQEATAKTQENELKNKEYVVALKLTEEGAVKFATATASNIGKTIPIVYDGEVICNPTVNSAISNGEAVITGMESFEKAEALATSIRTGALKLQLTELRSNVVGAKLGSEAIATSLKAALIGLILVILLMIAVYRVPGFASGIALVFYIALELVILNLYEITLTLPGIAGIILSIGMAVDANVIIFARIKEELTAGRTVETAVDTGFKKAMSAILDGNITTLIAAVVLMIKGTGSVKGFAQTLMIGIIISMFTALVVTRFILKALYALGLQGVGLYGVNKERKSFDFLSKRKVFFGVSIAAICAGFIFMGINGAGGKGPLNYSMEFKGGTSTNVTFNEDYSIADIDAKVVPKIEAITGDGNVETQKVAGSNEIIIKTRELNQEERENMKQMLVSDFSVDDSLITTESISSTISNEMKTDAIVAVIIATICMLIYIWFRFKDLRFAASAVLALVHDVLVVLAFYAISRTSVGGTFIACMLTIVGYSINATIVIFDRIREKLKETSKPDIKELVNESINQTLSRSIYTSLTTFIMVAVLFILGVTSIREFAMPLMVGIICGAYSSVCVTGALWFVFKKIGKK
ncbi:MAG: protein translocase subunit SecD [Lachnospiraceae bacterium]|jgi:SecD/SecF fusion protein|nr:protein translocase subunit SecD [Lachnospiraceae bacterium]